MLLLVPGRKTDISDAAWICQLDETGLLKRSFVPPRPIRELRDLTRYRKALNYERSRAINRLHKLLEDAGVKLACVATDVMGVSGRAMMRALIDGHADPEALCELAKGKLRKKLPESRKRSFPPPRTWPPGPACAPASASPRASASQPRRATAPRGSGPP